MEEFDSLVFLKKKEKEMTLFVNAGMISVSVVYSSLSNQPLRLLIAYLFSM